MVFRLEIFKSAEEDFRNVAEFYNPILERLGYEAQDEMYRIYRKKSLCFSKEN